MSYRLRPKAAADIAAIAEKIAVDHPSAAANWIETVQGRCQLLGDNPEMCTLRNDIRSGLRVATVGNYLILYQAVDRDADIVRVLHGARDLKRIFGDA
jgi:toxin ParE1/3/4